MVSHDQHLIESTVDELWAVEDNTGALEAANFQSSFADWLHCGMSIPCWLQSAEAVRCAVSMRGVQVEQA